MKNAEQNDKHENSKTKVYNKKKTNRAIRRASKQKLEDAPKRKPFWGYSG